MLESGSIHGHVDVVNPFEIRGWAVKDGIEEPQMVSVFRNGECIHELRAEFNRPGTVKQGFHSSGNCGFQLRDPFGEAGLKNGDEVRVKLDDLDLEGSPWIYSFERPKVFYMHIAKAGGTSVNEFFAKHLGEENCFFHIEGKKWDPIEIVENFNFISGHVRIRRIRNMIDLKGFYLFTVLREPVGHLMSHLAWVKGIAKNPSSRFFKSHTDEVQELALQLKEVDFENLDSLSSFFEKLPPEGFNLFDNCQSRYFLENPPEGKIDHQHWPEIEESLSFFNSIGLTSDLSEFSKSLAKDLHFRPSFSFPVSNVQKGEKPKMDEGLRCLIEPYIALDQKLISHFLK